jgi:hypothetical protein
MSYQPQINFKPVVSEALQPSISVAASKKNFPDDLEVPLSLRLIKARPSDSNSRDPESSSKRALNPQNPVTSEFTVIPGSLPLRAVTTSRFIISEFTVIDEGNTSSSLEPSKSIGDSSSRLHPWESEIDHPSLVSQVTRYLTGTFQDGSACAIVIRFKIESRLFADMYYIGPTYTEIDINYCQHPSAGD